MASDHHPSEQQARCLREGIARKHDERLSHTVRGGTCAYQGPLYYAGVQYWAKAQMEILSGP